jgi:hypothetical protein
MGNERPDASEDLDLVTIYESNETNAQVESQFIRGVLEAGGVPAIIVGGAEMPNLPCEVRVPQSRFAEAERLIAEAQAAGPQAAEEAERASEGAE